MTNAKKTTPSLDERNKEVHELNYVEPGKSLETKTKPNQQQARELAKKIQENIQAYQNEVNARRNPHLQAE